MKKFGFILLLIAAMLIIPGVMATTPISRFYVVPSDDEIFYMPHYQAMVYIDGTDIIAVNNAGAIIANGTAGTDDSVYIQAAADNITRGTIWVRNGATAYALKTKITLPHGILIDSDGAKLDVTELNDRVFEFNPGSVQFTTNTMMTGIRGISATGDIANTNTILVWSDQIVRGMIVENVQYRNIYKVVYISGASFSAKVNNVEGWTTNTMITLEGYTNATSSYAPNQATVTNCEDSGGSGSPSYGIYITSNASGSRPQGVKITNNWLEAMSTAIYDGGTQTAIIGNTLLPTTPGTGSSIQVEGGAATFISSNIMSCPASGYGIYDNVASQYITVTGNTITGNAGTSIGVYTGVSAYPIISGNRFSNLATSIRGGWNNGAISGNVLWGVSASSSIALNLTGGHELSIAGNYFSTQLSHITGSPYDTTFWGNNYGASVIPNITNGARDKGLMTSGANASTPDGGTVVHSLGQSPVWCLATPTISNETVAITAKSATTFTVAIKNSSTNAAGTTQTIYWQCGL